MGESNWSVFRERNQETFQLVFAERAETLIERDFTEFCSRGVPVGEVRIEALKRAQFSGLTKLLDLYHPDMQSAVFPAWAKHKPKRALGLDYGRVRIGAAVCDEFGISTRPIGFVPRPDDKSAAIIVAALAQREYVSCIVIGLPLHANGDAGGNVRWVRAFTKELAKVCTLPIHEVDERYSSGEAEEALRAEGRWPAKPGEVDARAAAILLRRWIDGEK